MHKAISRTIPLALTAVVIFLVVFSGFLFVSNSSLQSSLKTDDSQVSSLQTNVSSLNSQVTNLTSENQVLVKQITPLNNNISSLVEEIAMLNANLSNLKEQKVTLQNELRASQVNSTNLQNNIDSLNTQISSLQSQLLILKSQANLQSSIIEISDHPYATSPTTGRVQVIAFVAISAGYVSVQLSSSSDYANEGIVLNETFASNVNSPDHGKITIPPGGNFYRFTTSSDVMVFPVISGTTYIYLETSDYATQTATLSVTYYY